MFPSNHANEVKTRLQESGTTLLEILVAFAVLSIGFVWLSIALSNWRMTVFEAAESGRVYDLKERVLNRFDCNATVSKNLANCSTGTWTPAVPYDRSCDSAFKLTGKATFETRNPAMSCRVAAMGFMEFFFDYEKKSLDRKTVKRMNLVELPILCRTTNLPTKVCFP